MRIIQLTLTLVRVSRLTQLLIRGTHYRERVNTYKVLTMIPRTGCRSRKCEKLRCDTITVLSHTALSITYPKSGITERVGKME